MTAALRWMGLAKLVAFYRYFSFDGPRVTTGLGVLVLLGAGAVRIYLLLDIASLPAYLAAYFSLLAAGAVGSSAAMVAGKSGPVRIGWALGGLVSTVSIAMYIASRTAGLPGLPHLVGRWDYALGTFSMALAALFLALHFSVLTGMNVAHPHRRQWHD